MTISAHIPSRSNLKKTEENARRTVLNSQPYRPLSRSSDVPIQRRSVRIDPFGYHLISMAGKSWAGFAEGSTGHDRAAGEVGVGWTGGRKRSER